MDLYDQDSYSIPEDELRPTGTAHSTNDEDDDTSVITDMELEGQPTAYIQGSTGPPTDIVTDSPASEWKTTTSKKPSSGNKKHRIMGLPEHFDPSSSDRDLPHLRGRRMEEVQHALQDQDTADTTLAANSAVAQAGIGRPFSTANSTKVRYAHEL
jgi:hypothetical protein